MSHFYVIEHAPESGYYFAGFDKITSEPTWFSPRNHLYPAKILISGFLAADDFKKTCRKA